MMIAGGLTGGAMVAGVSTAAGAATVPASTSSAVVPAFSGPEPLPQLLQLYVEVAVATVEGLPALVAGDTTVQVDKLLSELEAPLRSV